MRDKFNLIITKFIDLIKSAKEFILNSKFYLLSSNFHLLSPIHRRKRLLIMVVTLLVIIPAVFITLKYARPTIAAWWDETWGYRKAIAISNSYGSTLTNFQTKALTNVDLSADIAAGKIKSDLGDLRFTDINGKLLPYWIEDTTTSSVDAWVLIPIVPASGTTIYMYYGNPNAVNTGNTAGMTTGGTVTTTSGYRIHSFKSSGTFTPGPVTNIQALVVGGGGGGGMDMGGGGGGGGVIYNASLAVTAAPPMPVSVGLGGNGAPAAGTFGQPSGHQYTIRATAGQNSTFGGITALGGGYGGSSYVGYTPDHARGGDGASGGGSSGYGGDSTTKGLAVGGQGYDGGTGNWYYSGGGGGAGGLGASATNQPNGGIGVENSILGTSYYWGGGGGGASYSLATGGNGGNGGGGGGAVGVTTGGAGLNAGFPGTDGCSNCWANVPGGNAGANTGGGGGGGSHYNANNKGGDGGSGIVIIKYTVPTEPSASSPTNEEKSQAPVAYWKFDEGQGVTANNSTWKKTGTITNMVTNPSFETNMTSWNYQYVSQGSATTSTDKSVFGSYSLKITRTVAGSESNVWYGLSGLENSTVYYYSAWAWASTPSTACIFTYNAGADLSPVCHSGSSQWERVGGTFTSSAAGVAQLRLAHNSSNLSSVYFDGIQVEKNTSANNYCDGSLTGNGSHVWNGAPHASGSTCDTGTDGSINGPTWQTEDHCVSGKCLKFDGSNDYVNVSNDSSLNTGNDITLSAWVYWNGGSGDQNIITKENAYEFKVNGGYISYATNPWAWRGGSDAPISQNKWQYVVITNDSDGLQKIYIDGVEKHSESSGGALYSNSDVVTIGARSAGTASFFNGFIDDVKIYNYARTAAQIKADFNSKGGGSVKGASVQKGVSIKNADALSNGLVGYWKMDETASPSVDSSGNNYSGTWQNSPSAVSGKYGNAISLNGSSHYILASNAATSVAGTKNLTVSFWIKNNSPNAWSDPISFGDTHFRFEISGTNTNMDMFLTGIEQSGGFSLCTNCLSNSDWTHIVFTSNDTSWTTYVNGVATHTGPTVGTANMTNDLYIGRRGATIGSNYAGSLDEVRIYNRALSPTEVSQLYNWAPGPQVYYNFEDGTGTSTINDSSGNANNGTIVGTVSNSNWVSGKFGKGYDFNGTDTYVKTPGLSFIGNGASEFTVSGWIYPRVTAGTIFHNYYPTSGWSTSLVGFTGGKLSFNVYNLGFVTETGTTPTNSWTYVTLTRDAAGNNKLYKNGVLVASNSGTYSASGGANEIGIGRYRADCCQFDSPGWFNGKIDEVKIYNYARTTKQIIEDMNAGHSAVGSTTPVGYWKFDEGYGSTPGDSSGHGYNGTFLSTPVWTNNCKFGKCLTFDNVDDGVSIANQNFTSLTDYTMCAWVNPKGNHKNYAGTILSSGDWNNTHWSFQLNQDNTEIQTRKADGVNYPGWNYTFPLNQWTHVCITRSGVTITAYANGKQVGSPYTGTTGNLVSNATNTSIGRETYAGGYFDFNGSIDEVKIYNSALTADEIKLDYNQGSTIVLGQSVEDNSDNPVGYWKMDESSGNTAYNSGSGTGNATWSSTGTWVNALINGAANVSGQYLVHSTTGLSSTNGTVEAWVKPLTGTDNYWGIWQTHDSGSVNWVDWISLFRYGSTFYFRMGNGSDCCSNDTTFDPTNYFPSDQWTHIAATWSGDADSVADDTMTIYVNGVQVAQRTNVNLQATMDPSARIGFGHTYPADGQMDEVKVYSYARSAAQIKADAATTTLNPSLPGAPVAEWNFEEGTGATVNDTSGNSVTGTWAGTGTHWTNGKVGKAGDFNGTNDIVNTTYPDSDKSTWTAEAWIYPTLGNTRYRAILQMNAASDDALYLYPSGNLMYWPCGASTGTVPQNQWTHVSAVYDSTGFKFYINGVPSGTTGACADATDWDFLKIGGATSGDSESWQGKIDQVKIYDYARTPAQVAYDYNRGAPVAWYKFDECQGTVANDSSGNGNTGTIIIGGTAPQTSAGTCTTSGTAWGNGAIGKFNSSLNLDGADDYVSVPYNDAFKFGTGDFTISWWANHTALSGLDTYYENGYYYAGLLIRHQGEMGVYIQYASGSDYYGFTWVPALGQWYHLTLRRQAGNLNFYVDGVQVGTTQSSTQNIQPSTPTFIGHSAHAGATQFFNGKLDDFRVYNYALTTEQIKQVYNNGAVNFGPATGSP